MLRPRNPRPLKRTFNSLSRPLALTAEELEQLPESRFIDLFKAILQEDWAGQELTVLICANTTKADDIFIPYRTHLGHLLLEETRDRVFLVTGLHLNSTLAPHRVAEFVPDIRIRVSWASPPRADTEGF